MIGVVVPAHNEEDCLEACLDSLRQASFSPQLQGEPVMIVVALDSCTDASESIARRCGARVVSVQGHNVGVARAAGAEIALKAGARWLAFTDADSVVAQDWLSSQLALQTDAVCGTVEVRDWCGYGDVMRKHYDATYTDADGHRHIHGANLGVSASAYRRAGGFRPLVSSEDVALVDALRESGASIAWSALPRVITSARRSYRAPAGFGATLERIDRESSHASSRVPAG
jgi:glycosyltransferase involved in cell wall biosynthesis